MYRRVASDGHVYFSDQPGPDAEKVEVRPVQTIRMPAQEPTATGTQPDAGQQQAEAVAYTSFSIVSPAGEEAVRTNNGDVTVNMELQPGLQPSHTIKLTADGQDGEDINRIDGTSIQLVNMSRGRHTVEAMVVDNQDKVLIQAEPVSFHVLRASR